MKNVVLITGASSGLGEEFAWQLAAQGYQLLLVARRSEKLIALQLALKDRYPHLICEFLALDLSHETAVDDLFSYISGRKIQLVGLINNAGFGLRGRFDRLPVQRQSAMIQLNVSVLVAITHAAIALLKLSPNSFIIHVASTAAFQAGPNLAVYYASKAFVLSFSEALHEELKGQIQVSAVCPGATKTEFAEVADMSDSLVFKLRVMEKQPVVASALKNRHKAIVIPGLINKIGALAVKVLPRVVSRKIAYQIQK